MVNNGKTTYCIQRFKQHCSFITVQPTSKPHLTKLSLLTTRCKISKKCGKSLTGYRSFVRRVICPKWSCADSKVFSPPMVRVKVRVDANTNTNPNPMPICFGQVTIQTSELSPINVNITDCFMHVKVKLLDINNSW